MFDDLFHDLLSYSVWPILTIQNAYPDFLIKGCLCYKTIFCTKVALDVWLINFFIWRKNHVSFSKYLTFDGFVKSTDFKIWDIIIDIAT